MSINKYALLSNISTNFDKLFISCNDGMTFVPPNFESSETLDALLVLCQLLDLMTYIQLSNDVSSRILRAGLFQIMTIKCKEFVLTKPWNNNYETFMASFQEYLNKSIEELIK